MNEFRADVRLPVSPDEADAALSRIRERLLAYNSGPAFRGRSKDEWEARFTQLQEQVASNWVRVTVRDERLAFLNRPWMFIKRAFHQLVVMYVNSLAGKQAELNIGVLEALDELRRQNANHEARFVVLEAEIARLNARLQTGLSA